MQKIADHLQSLIENTVNLAPGVQLSVNAPFYQHGAGFKWLGAAGVSNRETGEPLTGAHAFRIASMSKTFTGVLCAQLMEAHQLDLHAPAVDLLPEEIALKLPVADGYPSTSITPYLLLHHRAGFNDFALTPEWFSELSQDPGRFRPPLEIAHWAMDHTALVGAPDEIYNYSDTGYVLLGLILERATGKSYAQLCRERIFEPLQMTATYLEGHEEPVGELAHCYIVQQGEYIDALQVNGSCDWAGGGHVSTLEDIDRFLRGLFNNQLFKRNDTLDSFLAGKLAKEDFHYGMGIGRKQICGKTLWGHLGHWGSFMYYCPEERMSIAGMLGNDASVHNDFIERVMETLFQSRGRV